MSDRYPCYCGDCQEIDYCHSSRIQMLEHENARLREALKVISQNRTDERRIYTEGCECDDFARAALEEK